MENIILVSILAVIAVLLYLWLKATNSHQPNETQNDPLPGVPDIVGRPKLGGRPVEPTYATETPNNDSTPATPNFDNENKRVVKPVIPQEGPDEESLPDGDDEEEEMKGYAANTAHSIEDGLATGVTYDELAAMGKMLELDVLQESEKETTVGIASKIDGTELMQLLESKIGDASRRIAELLDGGATTEANTNRSLSSNDNEDFKI